MFERSFWPVGLGVVLVLVLTRTFHFTLLPAAYNGVYITQPFCGLHSWDLADRAWAARSHVKYGLRYTKGCRTLVVGDPPPTQPQYYVNHPALETWILAAWMLVFGTADWSFRLSDVALAIPALVLVLYVLRRLYGSGCALLAGLLLAVMPLAAFFGFGGAGSDLLLMLKEAGSGRAGAGGRTVTYYWSPLGSRRTAFSILPLW